MNALKIILVSLLLVVASNSVFAATIDTDTTWSAGDHYFNENVEVTNSAKLTIAAGAVVHFESGNQLIIRSSGRLIAQGVETNPVKLTSSGAVKNSWKGILIEGERVDGSEVQINHAIIENANYAFQFNQGSKGNIQNSVIRNNVIGIFYYGHRTGGSVTHSDIVDNDYGIYVGAAYAYQANHPNPVINHNRIYNNGQYNYFTRRFYDAAKGSLNAKNNWWGSTDFIQIAASIYDHYDDANYSPFIDYSGARADANGTPFADAVYAGSVNTDTTWDQANSMLIGGVSILSGSTLTIAEGVNLDASAVGQIIVKDGARLIIQGTETNPVTLTASGAVKNSWKGILIEGERVDGSEVQINHAIIENANYAFQFNQGSKGNIQNSVIRNNVIGLFYYGHRTGGSVTQSEIVDNDFGIYVGAAYAYQANHPSPVINHNRIYNNAQYNYFTRRFYDAAKGNLNARNNWWGSTDFSQIAASIYDHYDDPNYSPFIDYSGALADANGTPLADAVYAGSVNSDITWDQANSVLGAAVSVLPGNTLTIAEGVNLDASAVGQIIVKDGARLIIQGTETNPVTLTASGAVKNSWKGILVEGERIDGSEVQINHAIIENANYAFQFNQGSKGNIQNSVIRNNVIGIFYYGHRTGGSVTQSEIVDNDYGIYVGAAYAYQANHPNPVVNHNRIYNNTQYNYYTRRFYDAAKGRLNAQNNWWGSTDFSQIAASIHDHYDDANYSPFIDFSGARSDANGAPIADAVYAGSVNTDTTWDQANSVLGAGVSVLSGSTLTIAAGVRLDASAVGQIIVKDGARLIIQGTETNPVTLTASGAVRNSWKGILIEGERVDGSDIQINHALIEYAITGIQINSGSKADIKNSTIRHNSYGVYYYGKRTGGSVTQSKIYDNTYGFYVHGGYSYLANHSDPVINHNSIYSNSSFNFYTNYFYDPSQGVINARNNWWGTTDLTSIPATIYDRTDNNGQSVLVDFGNALASENGDPIPGTFLTGDITNETNWQFEDAYVMSTITVKPGSKLVIGAGSQFKFMPGTQLTIEKEASLIVAGKENNPITFTSMKLTPTAGDWLGIKVMAEAGEVNISHALIQYANTGLQFEGKKASGTVVNSKIINNNYGVFVNGQSTALADHPTPVITHNDIRDNTNYNYYSVYFGSPTQRTLNAKGNYWGTMDETAIHASIYDNRDKSSSPIVDAGNARESNQVFVSADAGEDIIAFGTKQSDLIGSGTSTLGDITGFKWRQIFGEAETLNNADQAVANFTPADVLGDQEKSFMLTVTDENGISASDTVNVTVKPLSQYNKPPVVADDAVVLVGAGEEAQVIMTATDPDNDPITYTWRQVSGTTVTINNVNTDTLTVTTPTSKVDEILTFRLSVTDGNYIIERDVKVAVKKLADEAGVYYYHNDHLGTPQVMTDDSAEVVWQASYTPFGKATVEVSTIENNIRFPGQYFDAETGLHYNYFRDYDPEIGRYIQSDPIGLAGGINTYGYVGGNPLKYIDPYGLTMEQVYMMLEEVALENPDLDVPTNISVSYLFNDEHAGITNPITGGITISGFYFRELTTTQLAYLYRLIVHESLHRTLGRWDMLTRPFEHDDIYEEANKRMMEYLARGGVPTFSCEN